MRPSAPAATSEYWVREVERKLSLIEVWRMTGQKETYIVQDGENILEIEISPPESKITRPLRRATPQETALIKAARKIPPSRDD